MGGVVAAVVFYRIPYNVKYIFIFAKLSPSPS